MTTGAVVSLLTALFKTFKSVVIKELYAVAWLVSAVDTLVALVVAILDKAVDALPATLVIAVLALEAIDA
jgi:hypothetical protein